jgi:hypothetical protein
MWEMRRGEEGERYIIHGAFSAEGRERGSQMERVWRGVGGEVYGRKGTCLG